ncbi:MAG: PIN domain-containing protein [Candidatus Omnitrophica bacterium]|nr:PIN domain-containing protein [Candidatus Omnitrophota bacterium]
MPREKDIFVVDANVILRYLLADHQEHFHVAKEFMERVQSGDIATHISDGVLAETVYVLTKFYKAPRGEVVEKLSAILSFKGVLSDNRNILRLALKIFGESRIDFMDAIILATARERNWKVMSFDKDVRQG